MRRKDNRGYQSSFFLMEERHEKLATAIDALKKFCEQVALTVGSKNGSTPMESSTGAQIKEQAARNATDAQIQSVRDKQQKEREQKLQETQLAPEVVALDTAAQDRDEKRQALETAKASGDKKAIRRAQVDYDRASQTYEQSERAKNQTDLDTSAQEMETALADYDSAGLRAAAGDWRVKSPSGRAVITNPLPLVAPIVIN